MGFGHLFFFILVKFVDYLKPKFFFNVFQQFQTQYIPWTHFKSLLNILFRGSQMNENFNLKFFFMTLFFKIIRHAIIMFGSHSYCENASLSRLFARKRSYRC